LPAKYLQLGSDAVHYLHTGTTTLPGVPPTLDAGALFLCVHGAGRNAGDFRRTLAQLAPSHSVVALDLPGHGRSTGLDAPPSIEACADVVEQFAAAVTRRPFVLVGWSTGALIALVVASRGGARLSGLVVLAAPAVWRIEQATVDAVRDVVRGRRSQIFDRTLFAPSTPLDVMREAWMEQAKTDPRVLHGDLVTAQGFDARPLLAKVRVPTLVVHGDGDQLVPATEARALADGIAGARFVSVEGAGHIPHLEQPGRVHEVMATFAAGLA